MSTAAIGPGRRRVVINSSYTLAMPTVAIVDRNGILRWIDVHPNYATRTEPRQILDALASLDL
jgi:hypothetical protein